MKDIAECIIRLHNKLMKERGIDKESSADMEIRPRNGITSETIVNYLLDIEEELDIELDEYLSRIRVCKTIGALIEVVEDAVKDQRG